MRFREGNRKVEVKWRSMVGREGAAMRLRGVEATFPFVQGRPGVHGDDHGRRVPLPAAAAGGVVPRKRARAHRRRPRARHGAARLQGGRGSGPDRRARPLPTRRELGQRPRARLPVGGRDPRPEGRGEAAPGERGGAADGHRSGGGEGDAGRAPRGLRRRDRRAAGRARAALRAPAAVLQPPRPTRSTGRRRSRTWTCGSARARRCPACPRPRGARSACAAASCRCSSGPRGSCWRRRRSTRPAWKSCPAGATRRSAASWRPT